MVHVDIIYYFDQLNKLKKEEEILNLNISPIKKIDEQTHLLDLYKRNMMTTKAKKIIINKINY